MGNRMCLKKRKKMMWEGQTLTPALSLRGEGERRVRAQTVTLTPALSLREREKGGFVLDLSPLPPGEG